MTICQSYGACYAAAAYRYTDSTGRPALLCEHHARKALRDLEDSLRYNTLPADHESTIERQRSVEELRAQLR